MVTFVTLQRNGRKPTEFVILFEFDWDSLFSIFFGLQLGHTIYVFFGSRKVGSGYSFSLLALWRDV